MTYKYIFLDLDDTLFDFEASEEFAIKKIGQHFDLPTNQAFVNQYKAYNKGLWQEIEKGTLTKDKLMHTRFPNFLAQYGVKIQPGPEIDQLYRKYLAESTQLKQGALNLLEDLKQADLHLFAASNGIKVTQESRIDITAIRTYFDQIFISEEVGYNKPDPNFFYQSFRKITNFKKDLAVMVGDNLSSDIKGANNANIDAIWFNEKESQLPQDFSVVLNTPSLAKITDFIIK